jgi:hypothetical protein
MYRNEKCSIVYAMDVYKWNIMEKNGREKQMNEEVSIVDMIKKEKRNQ